MRTGNRFSTSVDPFEKLAAYADIEFRRGKRSTDVSFAELQCAAHNSEEIFMETTGQPTKYDASDLTFLYDFVSKCPNPLISEAMKKLVTVWLANPKEIPHLPTAIKEQLGLSNEDLVQVAWLLAINPNTPPSVLADLCNEASPQILERIAENQSTWPETLSVLSYQALAEIRIATASNPHTPLASIMVLVNDDNPDIRFSMAENPNIPKEALEILSHNNNPYIQMRAEKTLKRLELEDILQAAERESINDSEVQPGKCVAVTPKDEIDSAAA